MKNLKMRKKIFTVVAAIFVGGLHFITGPNYRGPFPDFVNGYLIDILLPFVLYFLATNHINKIKWKILAAVCIILFGCAVEIMQYLNFNFLGSTFDPLDIIMYLLGVAFAFIIDSILFLDSEIRIQK